MLSSVNEAIKDLKLGKMIVVVDDENRENEGDLVVLAEFATPQAINFMAKYARGLICMPMQEKRLDELGLMQMVQKNTDSNGTGFTVSIDYKDTTTGISAFERSRTILKAMSDEVTSEDFKKPGHIFPLRAKDKGVFQRQGHTEAAVDLAKLCGSYPAGVICEIMNEDGTMARMNDLEKFCHTHDMKMISIEELVAYKKGHEQVVKRHGEANLPTKHGEFRIIGYEDQITKKEHVVLQKGEIGENDVPLLRVHSECMTGDVFGSLRCDCGNQLEYAMEMVNEQGKGLVIYLRQEGRGIGLVNKIKAYSLQDGGLDTVDANVALGFDEDLREYYMAAQMLKDLGIKKVKLLTNNPEKIDGLEEFGIDVVERIPIEIGRNKHNESYLNTKKDRMRHILSV